VGHAQRRLDVHTQDARNLVEAARGEAPLVIQPGDIEQHIQSDVIVKGIADEFPNLLIPRQIAAL
jgi:hypothetical protein